MMARPPWDTGHAGRNQAAPSTGDSRFDPYVPHPARVYNAWLGGKDNYAADRHAANEVIRHSPQVIAGALANRHFLARVVRLLAGGHGIRQFLDIGTGLPGADNTHESRPAGSARVPDRLCGQRPPRASARPRPAD